MYVNSITRGIIKITICKIIDKFLMFAREKTRSGIPTPKVYTNNLSLWTLKATTRNHSKVNAPWKTHQSLL